MLRNLNTVEIQTCFPEFFEFNYKDIGTIPFYQLKIKLFLKVSC
jgi:hypothetical protein